MHRNRILSMHIMLILSVLLISKVNCQVSTKKVQKRGVMDNFNEGLKFAGQMFGISTAADVANLVAKAFSSNTSKNKPDFMSIFQQRQKQETSAEEFDSQQQQTTFSEQLGEHQETQQSQRGHGQSSPPPRQSEKEDDIKGVDFTTAKLITSVLRLIGFDASKLGALAINALIMVAQAIGNNLMANGKKKRVLNSHNSGHHLFDGSSAEESNKPDAHDPQNAHQPRELRDGSPIDWFLQNPTKEMKRLLTHMSDTNLSDKVISMIEKLEVDDNGDGACLKMLMCKSSPFIWGMQKSLKNRFARNASLLEEEEEQNKDNILSTKGFFKHLPSVMEYRDHGEQCEERYANYCNTSSLYNRKS